MWNSTEWKRSAIAEWWLKNCQHKNPLTSLWTSKNGTKKSIMLQKQTPCRFVIQKKKKKLLSVFLPAQWRVNPPVASREGQYLINIHANSQDQSENTTQVVLKKVNAHCPITSQARDAICLPLKYCHEGHVKETHVNLVVNLAETR